MFVAAFAEIVSASMTLGSGNSGGIFGPCVVTGGMFGGAFGFGAGVSFPVDRAVSWNLCDRGMIAFFAAAAKAPISTIIMISEMTGGYGAAIKRTLMVSSSSCHVHASFLSMQMNLWD